MKKFFVLFCLVSLVPLLTGCAFGSLFGDDDDTPVPALSTAVNVIVPVIKVNLVGGLINNVVALPQGVNAAFVGGSASSLKAYLKLATTSTLGTLIGSERLLELTPTVTGLNLFFNTTTVIKGTDLLNGIITVRFQSPTEVLDVPLVTPTATTSEYGSVSAKTLTYALLVDFNAGTGVVVQQSSDTTTQWSVTNFPATLTVVTPPSTPVDPSTGVLKISKLEYSKDNGTTFTTISQDPAKPSNFVKTDLKDMQFRVTFAEKVANAAKATFTMSADNTKTSSKTTISALSGNATSVWSVDDTVLTITITSSVTLNADGNYTLTLTSFTGTNNAGKGLTLPVLAYFLPGQTAVSAITVNGTAIYPTSNPITAGTTHTTIVVTFDNAAPVSATGLVKLTRFGSDADRTNNANAQLTANYIAANSSAFSATAKTWTLTFNEPLATGKFYKVEYINGSLTDANGLPVKVLSPINFNTL